jgi:AhpC/TSA family
MAEDRFGDLGGDEPPKRSAAERFEEEDRLRPEPDMPPVRPETPRAGNKYAWLVGIILFMGIGVLLFSTALPNTGAGLKGVDRGSIMPDFAAPLATGDKEGDANVCQRAKDCNKQSGRVPACQVRSSGIFNVCDARRKPLILTFVFDKGADCNPQVDRMQRVKDEFPGVNFAVVFFSEEPQSEIAEIVRRREWTMPVAFTPDGAVVNLYGVGGCPTTVFAYKGGRVLGTKLGPISEDGLRARARRLLRG